MRYAICLCSVHTHPHKKYALSATMSHSNFLWFLYGHIGRCHLAGVRHFYYHLIFVTFHHDFNASNGYYTYIDRSLIAFLLQRHRFLSFQINFPRNRSHLSSCTRKCKFHCNCNFRNTCQPNAECTRNVIPLS